MGSLRAVGIFHAREGEEARYVSRPWYEGGGIRRTPQARRGAKVGTEGIWQARRGVVGPHDSARVQETLERVFSTCHGYLCRAAMN